jgi:hypothetical protein
MKRPAMTHRLRAPSPALVISLIALFVALGGGAAMASGLISGNQIVNHSIPAKKLTAAAVKTLHGQTGPAGQPGPAGPGAIAINQEVPAGYGPLTPDPLSGVEIDYSCDPATPSIGLALNSRGDQVSYSGEYAVDGRITPVTEWDGVQVVNVNATKTLNLELFASGGDGSHMWRIDLAEVFTNSPTGVHGCYVWGLVTPST